jgi:hypothetical protein
LRDFTFGGLFFTFLGGDYFFTSYFFTSYFLGGAAFFSTLGLSIVRVLQYSQLQL